MDMFRTLGQCLLFLLLCSGCASSSKSSKPTQIGILSESLGTLSVYDVSDAGVTFANKIKVKNLGDRCTVGTSARVQCPDAQKASEECEEEGCTHTGECICGQTEEEAASGSTQGHIYALCDCPDGPSGGGGTPPSDIIVVP
jgi:hypothetical protein